MIEYKSPSNYDVGWIEKVPEHNNSKLAKVLEAQSFRYLWLQWFWLTQGPNTLLMAYLCKKIQMHQRIRNLTISSLKMMNRMVCTKALPNLIERINFTNSLSFLYFKTLRNDFFKTCMIAIVTIAVVVLIPLHSNPL